MEPSKPVGIIAVIQQQYSFFIWVFVKVPNVVISLSIDNFTDSVQIEVGAKMRICDIPGAFVIACINLFWNLSIICIFDL